MQILNGLRSTVRSVTYSTDGRRLISGADNGTVTVWSLKSATQEASCTFGDQRGQAGNPIESVCDIPHQNRVAIGQSNGQIELWSIEEFDRGPLLISEEPPFGPISKLSISPDHRLLAVGGWMNRAALWQLEDQFALPILIDMPTPVTDLAWSHDGQSLAMSGYDGALHLLRAHDSMHTRRQFGEGDSLIALACSPCAPLAAVGDTKGKIVLWNLDEGAEIATLEGHQWVIFALAFTPDGRKLISGGADRTVRLWDVEALEEMHCYQWHDRWVTSLAVSPDGMTAAAGSADNSIVVWDLDD